MKKKLLYLTSIMLFSAASINAQTKVWDFSDVAKWSLAVVPPVTDPVTPQVSNYQNNTINDNLGIFPGTGITDFAIIDANKATWAAPDAFVSTNRLKLGGPGGVNPGDPTTPVFMPTQRFLYFAVAGPVTVKFWYRLSGANNRSLYVTNGVKTIGSFDGTVADTSVRILTVNYTDAAATNLYIFGQGNSFNFYKIEVTGALGTTPTLATNSFQKESNVVIYANNGKINLSNIESSTKVEVYNVLGALVKSAQVEGDTSLDINSGMYIVKAKSAEGEKSVKVLVK
jgi:hypothetical protein